MNDRDRRDLAPVIGWGIVTAILWVLGMLFSEELFAYVSFITAGVGIAAAAKVYKARLLQPSQPNVELQLQVADLQARLEEAETEIERLRAESDFDRKLMRSPKDT